MKFRILAIVVTGIALFAGPAFAQTPAPAAPPPGPPPAYGPPISLAQAKQVAAAAEAESLKLGLHQAIAIVEPSGDLVYFERMEGSSYAHIHLAQRKGPDLRAVQGAEPGVPRPGPGQ
jgi:glc operon protein GlcG